MTPTENTAVDYTAVFVVPPCENEDWLFNLYVGTQAQHVADMTLVHGFEPTDFTPEIAADCESILQMNGYVVASPWTYDDEYYTATVHQLLND